MVAELLKVGKENATSSRELVKVVGCASNRELQAIIARERKAGAVILSTNQDHGGYYLPANRAEVIEFCHTLESRGKGTFLALRSAKEYLKVMPGQESFSEDMQDGGLEEKH